MNRFVPFGGGGLGLMRGADVELLALGAPIAKKGLVELTAEVSHTFTQITDFILDGVHGELKATNRDTGEIAKSTVLLSDRNAKNFGIDLLSKGMWDLEVANLKLEDQVKTNLYDKKNKFAGTAIGLGCNDPTKKEDNGLFYAVEIPFASIPSEELTFLNSFLDRAPKELNLNTIASLSLDQIKVTGGRPNSKPVPLLATAWMLIVAFASFGWAVRRRRA